MSSHRAERSASRLQNAPAPRPVLLMLFGVTATAALPLEGGLTSHNSRHMQEVTEIKKNSLLSFPAWQYKQISQVSAAPFIGEAARKVVQTAGRPVPSKVYA
ncbi:hypothetical protein MC885_013458, partial [Smutsia gigantea]